MDIDRRVIETVSLEFSAVAREMNSQGKSIISFGLGEPDFETPRQIVEAAHKSLLAGETKYSSPWGISDLLSAIERKYEKEGTPLPSSHSLLATFGAKQALSLVLTALLKPKQDLILFSPNYVSFKPQILLAEPTTNILEVPLRGTDFSIDFQQLRSQCSNNLSVLLVNFPNNPTGCILDHSQMEALIEIAREFDAYIVCDEIYSQQLIDGSDFSSFIKFVNDYEKIVVINGFSKSFAMTGWRLGYLCCSDDIAKTVVQIQQHTQTNVPVFIQRAGIAGLELPRTFFDTYNARLTKNELTLRSAMCNLTGPIYVKPQGGMFTFIDLSYTKQTSDKLATDILRNTSVAVTPGIVFGSCWRYHIRISLACDEKLFGEGVKLLSDYLEAHF